MAGQQVKILHVHAGSGFGGVENVLITLAREKARSGTTDFKEWWNSDDGKAARSVVRPIMPEIQAICAAADDLAAQSDDEPFGASDEGRPTSDRGESHTATIADWITRIESAENIDVLGMAIDGARAEHGEVEAFTVAGEMRRADLVKK